MILSVFLTAFWNVDDDLLILLYKRGDTWYAFGCKVGNCFVLISNLKRWCIWTLLIVEANLGDGLTCM